MRHERQELLRMFQGQELLTVHCKQEGNIMNKPFRRRFLFQFAVAGCHSRGLAMAPKKKASAKKPKHEETWVGRMMRALEIL